MYQNAVLAEIGVVTSWELCEPKRKWKGIDIVVPLPWSLFTAVVSLPESDNDLWYGVAVWPSFWQSHMDIVIVDFEA
jgi:hypothetical protein